VATRPEKTHVFSERSPWGRRSETTSAGGDPPD